MKVKINLEVKQREIIMYMRLLLPPLTLPFYTKVWLILPILQELTVKNKGNVNGTVNIFHDASRMEGLIDAHLVQAWSFQFRGYERQNLSKTQFPTGYLCCAGFFLWND